MKPAHRNRILPVVIIGKTDVTYIMTTSTHLLVHQCGYQNKRA